MAIESPTDTATSKATLSVPSRLKRDFILCGGFLFRLCDVDGCLHRPAAEAEDEAQTLVYFKSYTAAVPDPDAILYIFLRSELHPEEVSA